MVRDLASEKANLITRHSLSDDMSGIGWRHITVIIFARFIAPDLLRDNIHVDNSKGRTACKFEVAYTNVTNSIVTCYGTNSTGYASLEVFQAVFGCSSLLPLSDSDATGGLQWHSGHGEILDACCYGAK